jgi:hypothetical protein
VQTYAKTTEAAAGAQPSESANPPFPSGRYEVALLEGTVKVANNDFRNALDQVQKLATDISRIDGMSAEVVESPLDVRPTQGLMGRQNSDDPTRSMEPRFVLRIVRARAGTA